MSKFLPFPAVLCGLLACGIALFIPACKMISEASAQVELAQLQTAHLGFIDANTAAAAPAQWDEAAFESEVGRITTLFTHAEADVPKAVPARRQFISNSADLFQRDATKVRTNHFLSTSYAAFRKKQIQQNYSLVIKP